MISRAPIPDERLTTTRGMHFDADSHSFDEYGSHSCILPCRSSPGAHDILVPAADRIQRMFQDFVHKPNQAHLADCAARATGTARVNTHAAGSKAASAGKTLAIPPELMPTTRERQPCRAPLHIAKQAKEDFPASAVDRSMLDAGARKVGGSQRRAVAHRNTIAQIMNEVRICQVGVLTPGQHRKRRLDNAASPGRVMESAEKSGKTCNASRRAIAHSVTVARIMKEVGVCWARRL